MKAFSFGTLSIVLLLIVAESHAEFLQIGLKTYYVESELALNWQQAWDYCAANNMQLFSIETDLERRLLEPIMLNKRFWTSGNELAVQTQGKANRKFVWGNLGRPLTYTNWNVTQPDNSNNREFCIHTFPNTKWNDGECIHKLNFICET